MDPEKPEADAAEQAREEHAPTDGEEIPQGVPDDVDPADLAEQARTVPGEDDDDY